MQLCICKQFSFEMHLSDTLCDFLALFPNFSHKEIQNIFAFDFPSLLRVNHFSYP